MAFALLAGAIPEVVELAGLASEATTVATGSETAGFLADQAVKTGASKLLEETARNATDKIFGEGSYDSLSEKYNYASDLGKKVFEGDFTNSLDEGYFSFPPLGNQNHRVVESHHENYHPHLKPGNSQDTGNSQDSQDSGNSQFNTKKLAADIATLSNGISNEVSLSDTQGSSALETAIRNTIRRNPALEYLVVPMMNHASSLVIPTDADYQIISQVYNGNFSEPYETEEGYAFVDETGTEQIWLKQWSPAVFVPAIFGTYTGIHSRNDGLPTPVDAVTGKRSYLDRIALGHDIDYKVNGSFDYLADMKLISRADAGRKQGLFTFPNELETANMAITYFASMGSLARSWLGNPHLSDNERAKLQNQIETGAEQSEVEYQNATILNEFVPQVTDEMIVQFRNDLFDAMREEASVNSVVSSNNYGNQRILQLFDSIEIELD